MKVLLGPHQQGYDPATGEFTWTAPDEIVLPDSGCPCNNRDCLTAFVGVNTRKMTTTAVVGDVDLTVDQVVASARDSMRRAWGRMFTANPEALQELDQFADKAAAVMLAEAARFDPDTRVRKTGPNDSIEAQA